MKRHLIDSATGEIIDISSLQPSKKPSSRRTRHSDHLIDLKLAGALTLLVAALYAL